MNATLPLIAVDVGNNRIKLGRFDAPAAGRLPELSATCSLDGLRPDFDALAAWLGQPADAFDWRIASVNRPSTTRLVDWLRRVGHAGRVWLLSAGDLSLVVSLPRPDMVGIDRLLDALAANRLREPDRPAVVVDVGSAITVDLVSVDGAFCGGAILPGIGMGARALHEFTDLLPAIDMSDLTVIPKAAGTSTDTAIRSGLFWGALGGIERLVRELAAAGTAAGSAAGSNTAPHVFLTGGAAAAVAELLGRDARFIPHLTLAGIALAALP